MLRHFIYPEASAAACQSLSIERSLSAKERDAIDEADFAGPDHTFPVDTQAHLDAAAHLIGHADDPDAVKRKAIAIARRKGFTLPKAWQEDEDGKQERTVLVRADGNHEPMTGTHTHAHPAFGSQGDDSTHEHEHSHDNDNNHEHSHEERAHGHTHTIQTSDRTAMYAPLMRIDAAKREVWGQATAEVPDSYGTIFGYYPDAWKQWRGNIREQHDGKKAVGKAIEITPDEQARAIYVGSRVSRGAQDTWLKVEDGVLTGYSVSIIPDAEFGPDPKRWPRKEYNGKSYPYLPRYTVAELSLVDNPACPGCNIQIVRADGLATEVLDTTEEESEQTEQPPLTRSGARISSDTQSANHTAIGHTLRAAVSQMKNCKDDCPQCSAAMKMIDPDGDGDIDLGGYDDPDADWQALYGVPTSDDMERMVTGLVERALTPVYVRLQGIASTLARGNTAPMQQTFETLITGAITRAVESARAASDASLSEVRAELSAVKETVERVANTPIPGAPIMNAGALPRSVEKSLPTDPYTMPRRTGSAVADAVAAMSGAGLLDTTEKQVDALAAALAAQRRG